jgi:hypothetical protein
VPAWRCGWAEAKNSRPGLGSSPNSVRERPVSFVIRLSSRPSVWGREGATGAKVQPCARDVQADYTIDGGTGAGVE